MINTNKLKAVFVANGKTQKDVAKIIGISNNTMTTKLKKGVFNSNEIYKMIDYFDIKNPVEIFFTDNVT